MKTTLITAHCPKCKRIQEFTVAEDVQRRSAERICNQTLCEKCVVSVLDHPTDLASEYFQRATLDPLAPETKTDFDYAAVAELLGEPVYDQHGFDLFAQTLIEVLLWIASLDHLATKHEKRRAKITSRALAALWVLKPGAFDGRSATSISRDFGGHRHWISERAQEFSLKFGITNRAQSHGRSGKHREKLLSERL